MTILSMFIYVPLLAVLLLFALINNELVSFSLWPLEIEMSVSLSVVVLFFTLIGFLWGRISAWFAYSPMRSALSLQKKENKKLSKEQQKLTQAVDGLKDNIESLKTIPEALDKKEKNSFFTNLFTRGKDDK